MKKDKSKKRDRDADEEPRKKKKKRDREESSDDDDDDDAFARRAPKKKRKVIDVPEELAGLLNDDDDDEGGDEQFDKLTEGKNTRRILPPKKEGDTWYRQFATHFNLGPDGDDRAGCIEPGGPFGHDKKADKKRNYKAKVCPACKKFCKMKTASMKMEFGTKASKQFWSKRVVPWRAKHGFVFAVTRPKHKEEPRKVLVHKAGIMIGRPLLQAYYDKEVGGGDFTNPKRGRNIVITKKQLSKKDPTNVEYDTKLSMEKSPLEGWDEIKEHIPDLDTFLPEKLTPEAMQALMDGDGSSDDDDEDEAPRKKKKKRDRDDDDDDLDLDDEDGDDDEDDAKERKLKLAKRKRREDDDVDPDAEEEDDDEDSDTKKRLKKRANRDADDEEEDEEEGDDDDADDDDEDDGDDEEEDDDGDADDDEESEDDDDEEDDDDDEDEDEAPSRKKKKRRNRD